MRRLEENSTSKRIKFAVYGALALGAFILIWMGARSAWEWLAIDTCADRGGSWHSDVKECSFTENYRPSE